MYETEKIKVKEKIKKHIVIKRLKTKFDIISK
jgi:hypothetical protein